MASPVDTSVSYLMSDVYGAPVLTGETGSGIVLLDAFLVDGLDPISVTSLVVVDGVATLTFLAVTRAAREQMVIEVAGVTGSLTDLNGRQKVTGVTSTTVTFATEAADGTASGTVTFKVASLGWTKVYSGTNEAAYKPSATDATGALLYVNDNGTGGAQHMRVRMYETMSSITTGTNPAPAVADAANGNYWAKSSAANSSAVKYALVGDHRAIHFGPSPTSSSSADARGHVFYSFGDLVPERPIDPYCAYLLSAYTATVDSASIGVFGSATTGQDMYLLRTIAGTGLVVPAVKQAVMGGNGVSGADSSHGPFPSPVTRGIRFLDMMVAQFPVATYGVRGRIPGLLYAPQTGMTPRFFPAGTLVVGTGEYTGETAIAFPCGASSQGDGDSGVGFFHINGAWR